MRIIVDAGVFFHPAALRKLRDQGLPRVVPAVAYAERIRQLSVRPGAVAEFDQALNDGRYAVESFGRDQARRLLSLRLNDVTWQRLARDAMIAAHVGPLDKIWTTNPRDFFELGLSKEQVVPIPDAFNRGHVAPL